MADQLELMGARIRGYRKAVDLTQAMLAAAAGLHTTYVSQIERGEAANVSIQVLLEISRVVQVPLRDLLDTEADVGSEDEEELVRIVQQMRRLPGSKRRAVLTVVDRLVEQVDGL